MRSSMKHSKSMKSKNTAQINLLQDKLFKQLQTVEPTQQKFDELQFNYLSCIDNPANDLIYRAKGITTQNQQKIQKARRQIKVSKKDGIGTFLTGTGLYTDQPQQEPQPVQEPFQPQIDHDLMLKDLVQKNSYDDLQQLRKMIKQTSQNLNGYSRQIYQTKKDVLNAANHFNSQIDYNLQCNLNKLRNPSKKSSSLARFKDHRYK